jgi:hypothetical protein
MGGFMSHPPQSGHEKWSGRTLTFSAMGSPFFVARGSARGFGPGHWALDRLGSGLLDEGGSGLVWEADGGQQGGARRPLYIKLVPYGWPGLRLLARIH